MPGFHSNYGIPAALVSRVHAIHAGVTHQPPGVTERRPSWSLQTRHTVTTPSIFSYFSPFFSVPVPNHLVLDTLSPGPFNVIRSSLVTAVNESQLLEFPESVWTSSSRSLYMSYSGGFSPFFSFCLFFSFSVFLATEQISRKFSTVMTNNHDDFE